MKSDRSCATKPQTTYKRRKGKRIPKGLEVIHPDSAGIDVGSQRHYVSVPESRGTDAVRSFGCYTPELERMAHWLRAQRIQTVVMEATGVYWLPVFRILEQAGFEVLLVNPRHVKYVPGRKTDVSDCQWLRQLHSVGLLRGAFVPPQEVAAMRTYWRQRKELVECCSREILHMQKALTQMNLHLHVALSDITGVSGMAILRAIVEGERDPVRLAQLTQPGVKRSREEIAQALSGHYTEEHLFVLRQSLELFDVYQSKIHDCDDELARHLGRFESKFAPEELGASTKRNKRKRRKNEPYFDLRTELYRLTGVDLCRVDGIDSMTAFTILSEIGFDVSAFPAEKQFTSWLGLAPDNRITGGRVKRRSTKRVFSRAANALRLAAQSLHKSKSYLGAYYRRQHARLGPRRAITATAHKLARIVYRLLKHGHEYVDRGENHLENQHKIRTENTLKKLAKQYGYTLINTETGECLVN